MGLFDFLTKGQAMLVGGGQNETQSNQEQYSTPAYHFEDLARLYNIGLNATGATTPAGAPAYTAPGDLRTLNTTYGTPAYNELETNLAATPLRRLSEDRDTATARYLANMRKIGMADDPTRFKLQEETIDRPYSRNVTDVLSNAAATTGQLALGENTALNTADTQRSAIQNQYNLGASQQDIDKYKALMSMFYTPAGVMRSAGTGFSTGDQYNVRGSSQGFADFGQGMSGLFKMG